MRDSVIVTNKARLALGTLAALVLAVAILCFRQTTATTSFADDDSAPTNSLHPSANIRPIAHAGSVPSGPTHRSGARERRKRRLHHPPQRPPRRS